MFIIYKEPINQQIKYKESYIKIINIYLLFYKIILMTEHTKYCSTLPTIRKMNIGKKK